jgi:DNA-binding SARP family transcriptional activator
MSEDKARANLRQTLRTLRETFVEAGYEGFNTFRSDPGFEPGGVVFDVFEIADAVLRDETHDVLIDQENVADSLLAGYEDVDPAFRTWLLVQRETLARKLLRDLQDRLAENPDASQAAKRLALAILQLDATHEPACQCVIRVLANAGDSAGAIAAYNKLCHVLDVAHGQLPSDTTSRLIVAIKGGTYRPSDVDTGSAEPARPGTIIGSTPLSEQKMVLIVGSLDGDGGRPQLAAVFRHELISCLSKFREWMLVDGEPAAPIGALDSNWYLLTVRSAEGQTDMNLMLSLKDKRTGVVVWSERFTIEVSTFYSALRAVMRQVAAKLNVYTSVERATKLTTAPESFTEAYDRWLLCQFLMWKLETREKAKEILRDLIRSAPNFSPGYSALSQMNNGDHLYWAGTYRTVAKHAESLRYANDAVRLDPLDSRAQLALAWSLMLSGRHNLALVHLDLAASLNEYDMWTITSCALGYAFAGTIEKAEMMVQQALELAPLPPKQYWAYKGDIAFLAGKFDESVEALELSGDVISTSPGWRTAALAHLGRKREARAEGIRFVQLMKSRWRGNTAPTPDAVVRWFLHCFPLRNEAATARLRAGLIAAGLPTTS